MTVLALATNVEDVVPVVTWGSQFAKARETTLTVLCWTESLVEQFPLLVDVQEEHKANELVDAVRDLVLETTTDEQIKDVLLPQQDVFIRRLAGPTPIESTLQQARIEDPELLVIAGHNSADQPASNDRVKAILRQSSCRTIQGDCRFLQHPLASKMDAHVAQKEPDVNSSSQTATSGSRFDSGVSRAKPQLAGHPAKAVKLIAFYLGKE